MDNSRIMLKIIKTISQLNTEQFLAVYEQSIRKSGRDLYRDFFEDQQVRLAQEDLLAYLRDDFFRQMDAFCAVWVADGVYRSALRVEPYRDGVLLHALETALDSRKMGYAFCLVTAVLEYLRQRKRIAVYSHIQKRNLPSIRLHEKCGFRLFSDMAVYIDGTVTQNSRTMMIKL